MLTKLAGGDLYMKVTLTIIALFLGMIAFRPLVLTTNTVQAQANNPEIYVEPGTTSIRSPDCSSQGDGKMMINLRTGEVWGFPTLVAGSPYPIDPLNNKEVVAKASILDDLIFRI